MRPDSVTPCYMCLAAPAPSVSKQTFVAANLAIKRSIQRGQWVRPLDGVDVSLSKGNHDTRDMVDVRCLLVDSSRAVELTVILSGQLGHRLDEKKVECKIKQAKVDATNKLV